MYTHALDLRGLLREADDVPQPQAEAAGAQDVRNPHPAGAK
jgi:hypothetical protein